MASDTATIEGFVSEQTLAHYRRLSQSGAALVFVEYTSVHPSGRSETQQLSAATDSQIPGLRELAQTIQQSGALAGLQLTHAGGKTESELTGNRMMSPSGIVVPVKDRELEPSHAMTIGEIDLWKDCFIKAADRAVAAGFDAVELHAAHGYGLNQWLSPITNQRNDDYGGSLENRMRLLSEIVVAIRTANPSLILSVRIPGQDFLPGGLSTSETILLAQRLIEAGVDIIHVSSGIGGWRRPADRRGEGYLVDEAALIQANVKAPVIGVGGIETGSYIDQALEQRKFTFAAVGRAILKAPDEFRENHLTSAMNSQRPVLAI